MAAGVVPSDPFRQALGDSAPEIAKLMPELRRSYEDIPEPIQLPPEQQRRYLFNSFQEFVDRLSRNAPVVWLLDDLHWADTRDRDKARQLLNEAIDGYRTIGMPRHLEMAKELTASL